MDHLKKVIIGLVVFIVFFHAVQKVTSLIYMAPLNGYFGDEPPLKMSMESCFDGSWQAALTIRLDRSNGFRNILVRLYNQLDYSLFGLPHARKVVVGRNGYLFEEQYVDSWLGRDFVGKLRIDRRVSQLKRLQDLLWKKKGILLVIALTPDKGSYFHEYLPDRIQKQKKTISNYQWYKLKLKEMDVSYIDYSDWFLKMKDTSRYQLFPKTGIHWSSYGAFLAFDSLEKFISAKRHDKLPGFASNRIVTSVDARDRDADLGNGMNLLCEIRHPQMTYSLVQYNSSHHPKRPSALFIGDSFYFTWSDAGYISNVFRNREFWYYGYHVYYGSFDSGHRTAKEDVLSAVLRQDVIVILQTCAGYGNIGYDFVDRLLHALDF